MLFDTSNCHCAAWHQMWQCLPVRCLLLHRLWLDRFDSERSMKGVAEKVVKHRMGPRMYSSCISRTAGILQHGCRVEFAQKQPNTGEQDILKDEAGLSLSEDEAGLSLSEDKAPPYLKHGLLPRMRLSLRVAPLCSHDAGSVQLLLCPRHHCKRAGKQAGHVSY